MATKRDKVYSLKEKQSKKDRRKDWDGTDHITMSSYDIFYALITYVIAPIPILHPLIFILSLYVSLQNLPVFHFHCLRLLACAVVMLLGTLVQSCIVIGTTNRWCLLSHLVLTGMVSAGYECVSFIVIMDYIPSYNLVSKASPPSRIICTHSLTHSLTPSLTHSLTH